MNPQEIDERERIASQTINAMARFCTLSAALILVQSLLVCGILLAHYFSEDDAYGVTSSGQVFKLRVIAK